MYPTPDERQLALLEFLEDKEVHKLDDYRKSLKNTFNISDEESTEMQKPKKIGSKPSRPIFTGDTARDVSNGKKYGHLVHADKANFYITDLGLSHLYFLRSKEKNNDG